MTEVTLASLETKPSTIMILASAQHIKKFSKYFQNIAFFNTDSIGFKIEVFSNPLARVVVLLALGHRAMRYVKPCWLNSLTVLTHCCTGSRLVGHKCSSVADKRCSTGPC